LTGGLTDRLYRDRRSEVLGLGDGAPWTDELDAGRADHDQDLTTEPLELVDGAHELVGGDADRGPGRLGWLDPEGKFGRLVTDVSGELQVLDGELPESDAGHE